MLSVKEINEKYQKEYECNPETIEKRSAPLAEYQLMGNKVSFKNTLFELIAENIPALSLKIASQISTKEGEDGDISLSKPDISIQNGIPHLEWQAESSIWEEKTYTVDIYPDGLLYKIKVKGKGTPTAVKYFTGKKEDMFLGSEYQSSHFTYPISANATKGDLTYPVCRGGNIEALYMTPPPFLYPFISREFDSLVSVGLTVNKGEYNFKNFALKYNNDHIYFELPLGENISVDGEWESPAIWCGFSGDIFEAVKNYSDFHYNRNLAARAPTEKYRWWKGPFYCGWGDHMDIGSYAYGDSFKCANQEFYTAISDRLDELKLKPTAIIIDDKWQENYGEMLPDKEKWPDLRKFSDEQHAKGRKVVLWLKAWNCEGIQEDECITLDNKALCVDPTNPKYIERVYSAFSTLLSDEEGCYNCDGFKIDFVDEKVIVPGVKVYDNSKYGIELMKELLMLYYKAAKAVKKDALINNSVCHPYFAETTDQLRLHDYQSSLRNQMEVMKYRRDLYAAAIPEALIDTDSGSNDNFRDAKEYYLNSYKLGVPDIYKVFNPIRNKKYCFTDADWAEIREVWEAYSRKMDEE